MIPLTDLEIERELFDLHMLPTYVRPPIVAEPVAPTVPAVSDATGSAAVHGRVADVSSPPLTSATPPPSLEVVHRTANTWTCWWDKALLEPALDIDAERAVLEPLVTTNGWMPLFKGIATNGMSGMGALFLPGYVTQDLTGHGLYFARTPKSALRWAQYNFRTRDLGVLLVAARADEMIADHSGKVRVRRCYSMRSLPGDAFLK